MSRNILFYDHDCGFCRWSISKLLKWDRRLKLEVVPLQSSKADTLLTQMDGVKRMESWHLVDARGCLWSGGSVAVPLFRLLPGGIALSLLAKLFPRVTELIYRWVSHHRDLLGRIVGEQACSIDPANVRIPNTP